MEKEFVPYEEALALKELGFDNPCMLCYYGISNQDEAKKDRLYLASGMGKVRNSHLIEKDHGITAPLYQEAFRWFRENHGLQHTIDCGKISNIFYVYNVLDINRQEFIINNSNIEGRECSFDVYEEAELACLIKLIEIVKERQHGRPRT